MDDDAVCAERYRWLAGQAKREGREGGWVGFYALPFIAAWDDSPYAHYRGEGFHYTTFDEAVDAARGVNRG